MTTGERQLAPRTSAHRAARHCGLALCACLAALSTGFLSTAQAQTTVSPDAREIIVGDVSASGFAIRMRCDGVDKSLELLSGRDLQNAYSRTLGSGGRVPGVIFTGENSSLTLDLESAGSDPAAPFVYSILAEGVTATEFASTLTNGRVLSVDRIEGRILTDGLDAALRRQNAICPF